MAKKGCSDGVRPVHTMSGINKFKWNTKFSQWHAVVFQQNWINWAHREKGTIEANGGTAENIGTTLREDV